ncbi:MAG TPA: hypothetical protein VKU89_04755, partial [Solirubrobacteraceae bacterium]|nr:hypothetical protein [Solirubrobacteraceae bacterium]
MPSATAGDAVAAGIDAGAPTQTQSTQGTSAQTSTAPLDCVVLPSACGYPDQSNTGVPAGTTLTPASGEVVVRTPGSVV